MGSARALSLCLLLVLLVACGRAPTEAPGTTAHADGSRTVVGADGVETTITDTSRIVTLSGDLTELVFALGLGSSVVATDVTTVHPPEAVGLPIVGVGRFLTAEGVLGQSPTLVLGDVHTAPATAIEQIRGAGVPVFILDVPTSFEGLYAKVGEVAAALGAPGRGEELVSKMRDEIAGVIASAAPLEAAPGVAFVYSRGPDVMLLFGSEMTTHPLIEAAGGRDVGAATGVGRTVAVTPEAIVAAAPDVIIITSEGLEALGGVEGLLAIPGFAQTPAGRDGFILDYPEGDILTFGPRIGGVLARLVDDLRSRDS